MTAWVHVAGSIALAPASAAARVAASRIPVVPPMTRPSTRRTLTSTAPTPCRQPLELVDRVRDPAVVLVADRPSGTPQGERSPVVAEPLPLSKDVGGCGLGERVDGREARHEPFPVGGGPLGLRLLRHRLRDEDRVWISAAAEREIASIFAVPVDEHDREIGGGALWLVPWSGAHGAQDSGGDVSMTDR
jgi:hypothetical protein